ncbi:hypothetical protein [Aquibacillus saliphilus]|uniref:hypothetical protein n=1 Tax=Aquibacillus saliphilus TaxID=1909422 RepID=UPI001CF01E69|nr:hypothetical protein [Aquibacillus saliphilus]
MEVKDLIVKLLDMPMDANVYYEGDYTEGEVEQIEFKAVSLLSDKVVIKIVE